MKINSPTSSDPPQILQELVEDLQHKLSDALAQLLKTLQAIRSGL